MALLAAAVTCVGCAAEPGSASAECFDDDDCDPCARCANGLCVFDERAADRPMCVDLSEDPCNGVDDDGNGVVDDPAACWTHIHRFTDPTTGAFCLGPHPEEPPSTCAGYRPTADREAFVLASAPWTDTVELRQCSLEHDHVLVPAQGPPTRPVDPQRAAAMVARGEIPVHLEDDELVAREALGYDCSLTLGHAISVSAQAPPSTPWANSCQLWRHWTPLGVLRPLGGHFHSILDDAPAEARCQPQHTYLAYAADACATAPPPSCVLPECPEHDEASLLDQLVPEDAVLTPGSLVPQAWTLQNTGTRIWSTDYQLIRTAGDLATTDRVPLMAPVAPGERITLEVVLEPPDLGVDLVEKWALVADTDEATPLIEVGSKIDVETPRSAELIAMVPALRARLEPGTAFNQTFTLRNDGQTTWTTAWRFRHTFGGLALDGQFSASPDGPVAPGETWLVSAPSAIPLGVVGGFNGRWELVDDAGIVVPVSGAAEVRTRIHVVGLDYAEYLAENLPDWTRVAPGEPFIKTWVFRNAGVVTWDERWRMAQFSGHMGIVRTVPVRGTVAPGESYRFAAAFTAPPEPGSRHLDQWALYNAGGGRMAFTASVDGNDMIGTLVWAAIEVADPCAP